MGYLVEGQSCPVGEGTSGVPVVLSKYSITELHSSAFMFSKRHLSLPTKCPSQNTHSTLTVDSKAQECFSLNQSSLALLCTPYNTFSLCSYISSDFYDRVYQVNENTLAITQNPPRTCPSLLFSTCIYHSPSPIHLQAVHFQTLLSKAHGLHPTQQY